MSNTELFEDILHKYEYYSEDRAFNFEDECTTFLFNKVRYTIFKDYVETLNQIKVSLGL